MNTPEYNDEIDITDAVKKTVEWTDDEPVKSKHRLFSNIKGFPKRIALVLSLTGAIAAASCDRPDTTNPTVDIPPEILKSGITITEPQVFRSTGEKVYLWNTLVATCTDESWIYTISLSKGGSSFTSWNVVGESCNLWIKAIDNSENKNSTSKTVKVIYENNEVPEYTFYIPEATIFEWDKIIISLKQVFAWDTKTFAWNSNDYSISLKYNGEEIQTGYVVSEAGTSNLEQTLTNNKNWKSKTWTTTITTKEVDNNQAPEITRKYPDNQVPNILWWVVVNMTDNQLSFWDVVMYLWKDDKTEICTPSLKLEWSAKEIKSWEIIDQAGNYVYGLTDENWKFGYKTFPVNSESINLSGLNDLQLKVDQKVDNLLKWITIPDGLEITKVEIEINGQRSEIQPSGTPNHYEYTPTQAWNCHIYVTLKGEFGNTYVEKTNLTINDIEHAEYQPVSITNRDPQELLSKYGIEPIKEWDKKAYEHIKDLGIAEGMRMRTMLWKYGIGEGEKAITPEQYEALMSKLNLIMYQEVPNKDKYPNKYSRIWEPIDQTNTNNHAHNELGMLIEFAWEFANLKVVGRDPDTKQFCWYWLIYDFLQSNPNTVNIFCCSGQSATYNWDEYKNYIFSENFVNLCNSENAIFVYASGNTQTSDDWTRKEKIYNGEFEAGPDWMYNESSMANSDENNYPNSHIVVTVWSSKTWHAHMIENSSGSLFPMRYKDEALLAGFAFPYYNRNTSCFYGEPLQKWSYNSSYTNYTNGGVLGLEFQLHADINTSQLLSMATSTSIENSISLETANQNLTQKLQRLSVAEYIKKYNLIVNIPSKIKPWETIRLTKWRYLGIVVEMPWAEVEINWEWVAYNKENESLIKSQNPMHLQWRINWDLVAKYSKDGLVTWKIIAVDDERKGLNMEKENITISLDRDMQRSMVDIPSSIKPWETIMLTNWSTKWLIYDIPWAQSFIKWKSWIEYNNENEILVKSQELKDLQWRLNWDLAMEHSENWYIKWTVYAKDDKWDIIDEKHVSIRIENDIQQSNNEYMA